MVMKTSGAPLVGPDHLIHLLGHQDETLRAVEKTFGVRIRLASEGFVTEGDPKAAEAALQFIDELCECVEEGHRFDHAEITECAYHTRHAGLQQPRGQANALVWKLLKITDGALASRENSQTSFIKSRFSV